MVYVNKTENTPNKSTILSSTKKKKKESTILSKIYILFLNYLLSKADELVTLAKLLV